MTSIFAQYDINLSANPPQYGTVSGGGNYPYGSEVTVIATPDSCHYFAYWSENSVMLSTDPFYTFIVTQSRNLVANFVGSEEFYTITVSANPDYAGTVTSNSIFCGEIVTVCAFANIGYQFINWTEDGMIISDSECYTFTVNSSHNLVANFIPIPMSYNITVSAEPPYCGEIFGGGNFPFGTIVTISAIPSFCCDFLYWGANGMIISTDQVFTFVVTQSYDFVAYFESKTFDIITSVNPIEGGTILGGGNNNIHCGDSTFVWAIPNPEYEFVNWTEDDNEVSDNALYAFPVFQSRSLVANFIEIGKTPSSIDNQGTFAIKIYPNPSGGELRVLNGELRVEHIEIYDTYGKKVGVVPISSETVVDISHLSAGVYFIKIRTEVGEVTRKVVKE
ncbi:MAG: T9SS type A sorting domain-containing protein [Bacteroidetes bacterium]|nr:T9SS type A sorting domain-containing protein [Bacteroidota bacterium]